MFWLETKAFGECIRAHRVHVFPKSPLPCRSEEGGERRRGGAGLWQTRAGPQGLGSGASSQTWSWLDAALLDFCCLLSQAYLMLSHSASRGKGVTQGLPSP